MCMTKKKYKYVVILNLKNLNIIIPMIWPYICLLNIIDVMILNLMRHKN